MSQISLEPLEARVLGVLLEKEITTPDVYPLSFNALTAGCNQKSSREPVMNVRESEVRDAVESLIAKTLVREQGHSGGRTRRFAHRMDSRLFGTLEFSREERAVLCVLLLRGAQTPGEIRSRSARLASFADVQDVERVLERLARREDGPHVMALAREPGRRELRHCQLFCGAAQAAATATESPAASDEVPAATIEPDRLATLEQRVTAVEAALQALSARLDGSA